MIINSLNCEITFSIIITDFESNRNPRRVSWQKRIHCIDVNFQVGDFLLLHLLGQNMNIMMFNEVLDELCRQLNLGSTSGASPTSVPSAPSTLEMSPIYPEIEKYAKDTEI